MSIVNAKTIYNWTLNGLCSLCTICRFQLNAEQPQCDADHCSCYCATCPLCVCWCLVQGTRNLSITDGIDSRKYEIKKVCGGWIRNVVTGTAVVWRTTTTDLQVTITQKNEKRIAKKGKRNSKHGKLHRKRMLIIAKSMHRQDSVFCFD